MKTIIIVSAFLFSIQAFACPDLSGAYLDKNNESVILSQKGCEEASIISRPITFKLLLDNVFTVVQDDADLKALGRGIFVDQEMVVEVKIEYKRDQGIPQILLPVRGVNKYSQTASGDLLEKSVIYNKFNGVLANTKTTYRRDLTQ